MKWNLTEGGMDALFSFFNIFIHHTDPVPRQVKVPQAGEGDHGCREGGQEVTRHVQFG